MDNRDPWLYNYFHATAPDGIPENIVHDWKPPEAKMDPSIIKNREVEEAESYVVSWGKSQFVGKTFDECPDWYLRFIAENFRGTPAKLADTLLQWRKETGTEVEE